MNLEVSQGERGLTTKPSVFLGEGGGVVEGGKRCFVATNSFKY